MGSVFRKTVTRPLPPDAEIIERKGVRLARYRDARGKAKTTPLTAGKDGAERIREESSTYFARYWAVNLQSIGRRLRVSPTPPFDLPINRRLTKH